MKNYVSLAFKSLSQSEIIVFATNVFSKMSSDPQFAFLKPDVDALDTVTKVYSDALSAASTKDSMLVLIKNTKLVELQDKLSELAAKVNEFAKGDKVIVKASGFDYIKDPKSLSELATPTGLEVDKVLKQSGKVKLSWDKVDGIINYVVEMRIKGEETWMTSAFPSARTVIIKDLKPGTNVEFRVRALGTRNLMSDWSQIVDIWIS